ncbi:gamma-glutamyl cyclotransferase [Ignicoccus islandicus DSM 13165]|uniref:Gamma-glutamyl cyclotransferase n=1 Tax=Ignicoccus islandicus DSM 13165 TaxID=940295 RepID=A0A0U3FPJ6_9CREN|nr:gamma-glutamylcyclotransferase family protein [Ignicoccus islandicus]ALU11847.1 gamma-glutamyl cyclotransferase [Ignicoccus islandicus DSM 13165]
MANVEPTEFLFTYGTLMRGCPTHDVLVEAGAVFLATAVTTERHTLYEIKVNDERYPALLVNGGEHYVEGELYLIPQSGLEKLDVYEGVTEGEYIRTKLKVLRKDLNKVVEAFAYVIDPEELEKLIAEGKAKPLVSLKGDVVRWEC